MASNSEYMKAANRDIGNKKWKPDSTQAARSHHFQKTGDKGGASWTYDSKNKSQKPPPEGFFFQVRKGAGKGG